MSMISRAHPQPLVAGRKVAIPGAIIQSAAATAFGMLVAQVLGWTWSAAH